MDIAEIQQQNEKIYSELLGLKREFEQLRAMLRKPEGDWRDCLNWLIDIPGSPNISTKKSLGNYCGKDKLFKPDESFKLVNNRRVFIRAKVEEAVRKMISNGT